MATTAPAPINQEKSASGIQGLTEIDQVVTYQTLHYHLSLLHQFKSLENSDNTQDLIYLVKAESRYQKWLELILQQIFNSDIDSIPLPPIDVALMWHAHMLSPYRYYDDCLRMEDRYLETSNPSSILNYVFPLGKLHDAASPDTTADEKSIEFWESNTKEPFVLPRNTPPDERYIFTCPWCNESISILMEAWMKVKTNKGKSFLCSACKATCSVDTLSALRFFNDVDSYYVNKTKNRLAGTYLQLKDGRRDESGQSIDHTILLEDSNDVVWQQYIRLAKSDSQKCSWKDVVNAIVDVVIKCKVTRNLKNLRKTTVPRIRSSYMGIIPTQFSIDLIAAVLRQRDFTEKMVHISWDNSDILTRSITRYHKFLLLITENPNTFVVPTLDIDLAWHTHLLHPHRYRAFTLKQMKRIINHDDTVSTPKLNKSLVKTSSLWYDKFKEPYTTDDPSKLYLTGNKIAAGVLFPPYGVHVLLKTRKLKKAWQKDRQQEPNGPLESSEGMEKETSKGKAFGYATGSCGASYHNYYPYYWQNDAFIYSNAYYYSGGCATAMCSNTFASGCGANLSACGTSGCGGLGTSGCGGAGCGAGGSGGCGSGGCGGGGCGGGCGGS